MVKSMERESKMSEQSKIKAYLSVASHHDIGRPENAQRVCGGCGGTGLVMVLEGQACGCYCYPFSHNERCLVCAGRGTVNAKASRADAVADSRQWLLNRAELKALRCAR